MWGVSTSVRSEVNGGMRMIGWKESKGIRWGERWLVMWMVYQLVDERVLIVYLMHRYIFLSSCFCTQWWVVSRIRKESRRVGLLSSSLRLLSLRSFAFEHQPPPSPSPLSYKNQNNVQLSSMYYQYEYMHSLTHAIKRKKDLTSRLLSVLKVPSFLKGP